MPEPQFALQGHPLLHVLDSGASNAAYNMALDEALLESMPRLNAPVLRFYGWTEPAASFGYFQKYADVAALTPLRPLVRRPTGGGIVPHDHDWTYSLSVPTSARWYSLRAIESYRRIHEWIQAAFKRMGLNTELAPDCHSIGPGQCFAGYERFDLLFNGRKVAGAAQRRSRTGLLIQGSVQSPRQLQRERWHDAMAEAAAALGFEPGSFVLDETVARLARDLSGRKYGRDEFNQKR